MQKQLHRFTWRNVTACLVIILVFGDALVRGFTAFPVAKVASLLLVAAKYAADFPLQYRFTREARARGESMVHCAILLLPTFITGFQALTATMVSGLFNPQQSAKESPAGRKFDYLKKGSYNTALLIALIACMVDVPFSALVIEFVAPNPALRFRAHAVLLTITIYCVVMILADRKMIRSTAHAIDSGKIKLRIAARFGADIPLGCVDHVEEVRDQKRLWCLRKQIQWFDTMIATPFDQPNAVIALKENAEVPCMSYGVRCFLPRYIFIYVDEPGVLASRFAASSGVTFQDASLAQ